MIMIIKLVCFFYLQIPLLKHLFLNFQGKTTADDYKPISYHTISTTTNSSSSRPPSSVKVNPSSYRGKYMFGCRYI